METKVKEADSNKTSEKNILPSEGFYELINNDDDILIKLDKLYQCTEKKANNAIEWFLRKKERPARYSRSIRSWAIIFTTVGGVFPILQGVQYLSQFNFTQYGYIALALAAGLVGFDKYFGFSSSWMRYMLTQIALQQKLDKFHMDWLKIRINIKNNEISEKQIEELCNCIQKFRMNILTEIENEIQTWKSEFQNNLMLLEKNSEEQKDLKTM
jgi:hypothetical protein